MIISYLVNLWNAREWATAHKETITETLLAQQEAKLTHLCTCWLAGSSAIYLQSIHFHSAINTENWMIIIRIRVYYLMANHQLPSSSRHTRYKAVSLPEPGQSNPIQSLSLTATTTTRMLGLLLLITLTDNNIMVSSISRRNVTISAYAWLPPRRSSTHMWYPPWLA